MKKFAISYYKKSTDNNNRQDERVSTEVVKMVNKESADDYAKKNLPENADYHVTRDITGKF